MMLYCTPPTQHVWSSGSLLCGSNGMELHSRQWRRNESESGAAQRRNFFCVVPGLHFLALKIQLVVLVSVFVIISTVCQFRVCCSSTLCAPRAQQFLTVETLAPCAPWSRRYCFQTLSVNLHGIRTASDRLRKPGFFNAIGTGSA